MSCCSCIGYILFFNALQNGYLFPEELKTLIIEKLARARAAGVSRDSTSSPEPVLPGIGLTRREWLLMRYAECVKHDHMVSVGLCLDLKSQMLEKKSLTQKVWDWGQVAQSWFKL
ncbi:unnamed protein product [Linum trigynum]|uniref:Uncharacterized protein n=1 Tax=Linum trigynum TaxID=586398 RepID=A0AAV2F6S7_9ROSI